MYPPIVPAVDPPVIDDVLSDGDGHLPMTGGTRRRDAEAAAVVEAARKQVRDAALLRALKWLRV